MTDTNSAPAAKPVKAKAAPRRRFPLRMGRTVRDLGPYVLAVAVFAITAKFTLNTAAAHYADELFTIALVLIRANGSSPPAPPAS